jgi:hypothetical protein
MPDRTLRESARFSERLETVSKEAELMFWRMITVPDDFGVYYADPAQLRAAIWPMNKRNIRIADVARWRDELAQAGIIAQFEVSGMRYIELLRFGQAGKMKWPKRRHPAPPGIPEDPGQLKMELSAAPPPEAKRREEKRVGSARRATPAPENSQEWTERLRERYPHIDIDRELAAAMKNRQKAGKGLDRKWFEDHWLSNIGEAVVLDTQGGKAAPPIEPEPEAWRLYLKDRYEQEDWAETAACCEWAALPANWRAKIAREMREAS